MTPEEKRKYFAELEKKMDSGEQPFVYLDSARMAVSSELLVQLGLEQGQEINTEMAIFIIEKGIENFAAGKTEIEKKH